MKRLIMLSAAALCAVTLTGCGSDSKTLYEHGQNIISEMSALAANEEYGKVMTGGASDEINAFAAELAKGDYGFPTAVYRLEFDTEQLEDYYNVDGNAIDDVRDIFSHRLYASIPSVLNAGSGASAVAAASVYTGSKLFVYDGDTDYTMYLYSYDDAYPVIVVFTHGEGGATSANGTFLLVEELRDCNYDDLCNFMNDRYAAVEITEIAAE